MKIRPIILCGGAGTRLWPDQKKNLPKQFVDFGGWTLIQKTLERIKAPIFDFPVIKDRAKTLGLYPKRSEATFTFSAVFLDTLAPGV